jgi:hypothetical protein
MVSEGASVSAQQHLERLFEREALVAVDHPEFFSGAEHLGNVPNLRPSRTIRCRFGEYDRRAAWGPHMDTVARAAYEKDLAFEAAFDRSISEHEGLPTPPKRDVRRDSTFPERR